MNSRYIAFDIETPNYSNDRISAIGITVFEHGKIVKTFYSLVNPETYFTPFHISLTQITPAIAAEQPTFPELWQQIAPLMDSGLLIAHNAPFDMSVLGKCLRGYDVSWHSNIPYACTCQISRHMLSLIHI